MTIAFFTLGCKVNQYETANLQRQFADSGYDIVEHTEIADVYVVNSCTVTSTGDKKSLQILRRMRRQNPSATVCLVGCFPQAFPSDAAEIYDADIIMGAKDKAKLLDAVGARLRDGKRIISITPHDKADKFEDISANISDALKAAKLNSRTRAFVKIEDGCRRFCAYCIIPTARGPVRSKPLSELKAELEAIAAAGYIEVVLVGINLSCYGEDLGLRLIDAVKLADSINGIERVRLGSLEPELLTTADIAEMAALKKLCPQFHLSLQSGCDATLKRMKRHYDTAEYMRIVADLRKAFPTAAITTDVMVGFPGETDDEFLQSLEFCTNIGLAKAHVFAYSKRKGTLAERMPDQISQAVKTERSRKMIAATDATRQLFLEAQVGTPAKVLFEQQNADGFWEGYSENYTPVMVRSDKDLGGKVMAVVPTMVVGDSCVV